MRIGKLDSRIILQVNTPTKDGVGDLIDSWSTLATVWADVLPISGSEGKQDQQELARANYDFLIRYRSDLTPKHRINHGGDLYDIEFIEEVGRKDASLVHTSRNVS